MRLRVLSLIALGAVSLAAQGQSAASGHVQGRILVQRVRGVDAAAAGKAYLAHGAKVTGTIPRLDVDILSVPEAAAPGIMRSLMVRGMFSFAEADGLARGSAIPNDPAFGSQWHLTTINAPGAWDMSTGSNAPIAMIDSGVNQTHPDLAPKLVAGFNFLNGTTNTADVLGHGSATAGTAAAATDNSTGVSGVAWQNPIMPLVVLDSSDYASYSNIASAITWAADHGARVINISIGGSSASSTLQSAVNYAWSKGAVIFASAMNASTSTPYYPAACDYVVAVSSTEANDTLSGFSNYGSWIDLAAPGNNILTTDNSGGYSWWAGTSFSSPIAAGTAALALSINPALSAQALVNLLEQNADDLGAPGFDTSYGWGRVNASRVATAAKAGLSSDTTPPAVTIASPAAGSTVSGTITVSGLASDNSGVTSVELWIDGVLNGTCVNVSYSCGWNSAASTVGVHTVMVKAYDAAGNVGSASEAVNVAAVIPTPDTTAPTVQIMSPSNGALVSGNVKINVAASDNVGVRQVSIYVDGVLKGSFTSAPYTAAWNTAKVAAGSHTISAQAWDGAGNTASTSITVKR